MKLTRWWTGKRRLVMPRVHRAFLRRKRRLAGIRHRHAVMAHGVVAKLAELGIR